MLFLVDAFADEAEMYNLYFTSQGFVTRVFGDPRRAIAEARRTPPHVMIAQARQPGAMSGLDLVSSLKSHDETSDVPVLMITTSLRTGDRQRALRAGCASVLMLPVVPDVLLAEVRRAMSASRTPPTSRTRF